MSDPHPLYSDEYKARYHDRLRDYAVAALQGMMARSWRGEVCRQVAREYVKAAYLVAEAMIEEDKNRGGW